MFFFDFEPTLVAYDASYGFRIYKINFLWGVVENFWSERLFVDDETRAFDSMTLLDLLFLFSITQPLRSKKFLIIFFKVGARGRRLRKGFLAVADPCRNFAKLIIASCVRTRWPWAAAARACGCGAGAGSRWLADAFAGAIFALSLRVLRLMLLRFAYGVCETRFMRFESYDCVLLF